MEYPSRSKCSQKWGRATVNVSSLEYFLLNSSMTNGLQKKTDPDINMLFSTHSGENKDMRSNTTAQKMKQDPKDLRSRAITNLKIFQQISNLWLVRASRKDWRLLRLWIICGLSMKQPFVLTKFRDDWDEQSPYFLYPRHIKPWCYEWALPCPKTGDFIFN